MCTEVLQSGSWVRGPDFVRTKQIPLVSNTDVVDNIKLGVVTKEQDDDSISSLAASVTKPPNERSTNLIPFDEFSCYQKLLPVTVYVLRLQPSHENYHTVDGSIADHVEHDKAERHLQYLTTNPLRGLATLLSLRRLFGRMASSVLLVGSDG